MDNQTPALLVPRKVHLTPREGDVLTFIESHLKERGWPPTRREIADHFGWRSATAADLHVKSLGRKGYIRLAPTHRGIAVL